jgi:hypothetical protein
MARSLLPPPPRSGAQRFPWNLLLAALTVAYSLDWMQRLRRRRWRARAGGSGPGRHHRPPSKQVERYQCSFCGKSQAKVERLIAGPGGVSICNECVDLCNEIISAERQLPSRS